VRLPSAKPRRGHASRLVSAAVSLQSGSEGASADASREDLVFVAFPETPPIVPYPEASAAPPHTFLTQLSPPASLYSAVGR